MLTHSSYARARMMTRFGLALTAAALCLAPALGCERGASEAKSTPQAEAPGQGASTAHEGAQAHGHANHGEEKAQATPAREGLDAEGNMRPGAEDRCPVCGMRVDQGKFTSAIELEDHTTYYFCGTGCMLKSWLHPEIYLGKDRTALGRAVTMEYFDGKHIDASTAWWVAGSDVSGPMGRVIVPLATEDDMETFRSRHGGEHTFRLEELDDARWKTLMKAKEAAKH